MPIKFSLVRKRISAQIWLLSSRINFEIFTPVDSNKLCISLTDCLGQTVVSQTSHFYALDAFFSQSVYLLCPFPLLTAFAFAHIYRDSPAHTRKCDLMLNMTPTIWEIYATSKLKCFRTSSSLQSSLQWVSQLGTMSTVCHIWCLLDFR